MTKQISCIIPFYNEGDRIFSILDELSKIHFFSEIICVNDGSIDQTPGLIRKFYPKVKVIDIKSSKGKSEAVRLGLEKAREDYIFLVDADLQNFSAEQLENIIKLYLKLNEVDMVILKRNNNLLDELLTRYGTILSGERLMKKTDLMKVFTTDPQAYQLEIAINKYMIDNNKNVYHATFSANNTSKIEKFGLVSGLMKHFRMQKDIVDYAGPQEYLKQMLFFGRRNIFHPNSHLFFERI